jgi:hypothetical protein
VFGFMDVRFFSSALTRLAIVQNEQEWWENTKADDKALGKVIKNYKEVCPDSTHGVQRGGGQFKVATYKEKTNAETNVDMKERGKMMWWGEYEEFSRTAAGGRLSSPQAKARWDAWKNFPGWIRDNKGPNPDDTFQLWVPTGVTFDYGNKLALQKDHREREATTRVADVSTWEFKQIMSIICALEPFLMSKTLNFWHAPNAQFAKFD